MVTASSTSGLPKNDPRRWEEVTSVAFPWLLQIAALTVWQLDEFYKANPPELFIYDFGAYAGRIFAKRLNLPVVQYYHDFIHHSGIHCWDGGVGYKPEAIVELGKLLDSFLCAYGFEGVNNFWHTEELNLCPFPKEFQLGSESLDDRRFCFVGPFIDRPFTPMWLNRSGGRKIVLVSAITGSIDGGYFNKVIEALSELEYHVILSVGEHFPLSELQAIPKNFEINRYASHLEILPHAHLHLYSGGIGGTLEGFYFGVRLIAIPSYAPNYRIASHLAERGLLTNLPLNSITSRMIRETVESVMHDDAILVRLKRMQNVVRNSGGSARAIDRIEGFLAQRARA
jgi:MGT family glycosyltransferase